MDNIVEEWRDVYGKPGWRVSNTGRVQSCCNPNGREKPRYLDEYRDVVVARPHLLVWAAFVDDSPRKNVILQFVDGDKNNCSVSNLKLKRREIIEREYPLPDRFNVERYRLMMARYLDGFRLSKIAIEYGLSKQRVYQILHGNGYRHRLKSLSRDDQDRYYKIRFKVK